MRTLRWFLFTLPCLFALGCEDPETPPTPARVADISTRPTDEQTDVDVVIQGAGTVERWENGPGVVAPVVITNPTSPIQYIPKGDSVQLVAVFESIVHPIQASFIDEAMATQYSIEVDELLEEQGISVQWSGPTCGDWTPQGEQLVTTGHTYTMTWHHPHPPCDATTDHHDVTIRATIRFKDQVIVCEYQGAKSGEGPACK
jgi:hypothetical protein